MTTKERYEGVLGWFAGKMPVAESELKYNDPFELIVAVILSAQCTDKRVNMTTPALFERFPDAKAMAAGTVEDIYQSVAWLHSVHLLCTRQSVNGANRDHYTNK